MAIQLDSNNIWRSNSDKDISYPDEGNNNSLQIEETSFWFKHRNEIIREVFGHHYSGGDIVDIGGGNGFQAKFLQEQFPQANCILVEPGYNGCLNAKKRGVNHVYNMTFQDFPFENFDVKAITLLDVVEHIPDDVQFLKELRDKMPRGAKVFITVPSHNYLWSSVDPFGGHQRRYNKKMAYQLAKDTGFDVTYFSYFFRYLVPISFVMRALPYRLGFRKSDEKLLHDEQNQHNPDGMVLKYFQRSERKELEKIRSGKSIGNGASCFIVLQNR